SISIGGRHIANWLIGQVRNEAQNEAEMMRYADEIGADRDEFRKALSEVPVMSKGQFEKVADALFLFASELSLKAYQNVQQSRFIAEQKRAENALIASERKFRTLLEDINLIAVMLDQDGNITFCNDCLLQLTGWTRTEVLNGSWFRLFLPEDVRETVRSVFVSGISGGSLPLRYENEITTRGGKRKLIVWNNSPLRNPEGKITGVASIGIDVTEHRKLEEQLRQSQKMEAIGTLAGGVAHDFNNILSAIIGFGAMAQQRIKDDEKARAFIGDVLAGAKRGAELTHGLLAFSRKQTISLKHEDLNSIVRKMHAMLARIIREDIELKTLLAEAELPVLVDASQMDQVLLNLATNARDAMPDGGYLIIQTEEVLVDRDSAETHLLEKSGRYATLTVSDTGIGMDLKTKENIFEPFFTTKGVGKGTGLGLAVVYGIVKQHEGHISVYSEPGKGTTFRVYLPMVGTTVKEEPKADQPVPFGKGEMILIAEDDTAVRKITRLILEELGYRTIGAANGEEAIGKFLEHGDSVALLLMDVVMPLKNGGGAYEEIRKLRPGIKAIFTSGYTDDIIARIGVLAEGVEFISKPVNPDALARKIREMLDR
ncbi:MAG TPA: ATP-binding protein, partial [Dissulfurispiraceae bacterium]